MNSQHEQGKAGGLHEKDVVEYLRTHADFFVTHGHLLTDIAVPHESGGAVSLIERQVSVLRDQNRQLRRELMELVQIARENDRLNERLQRLTVALMESANLSDIFFILHDALRNDFNADGLAVCLFTAARDPMNEANDLVRAAFHYDADGLAAFKKILDAGKPVCGRLTPAQLQFLFQHKAGEIASTALVPLSKLPSAYRVGAGRQQERVGSEGTEAEAHSYPEAVAEECFGMMAIGSYDAERFHPAMGTLFLAYMSAIISRALTPYLKL